MTVRLDMISAASRAGLLLGDSASLVADFVAGQLTGDGGFRGRTEKSDLYYTVFGIESLRALGAQADWEKIAAYLEQLGSGEDLDFVHLCCLWRCWASACESLGRPLDANVRNAILRRIAGFRSKDGGFSDSAGAQQGTAYGCFLALGLYQDLEAEPAAWAEAHPTGKSEIRSSKISTVLGTPYGGHLPVETNSKSEFSIEQSEDGRKDAGVIGKEYRISNTPGTSNESRMSKDLKDGAKHRTLRDAAGLVNCIAGLRTPDGGYANSPAMPIGATPAAAAAIAVLHYLGEDIDEACIEWLLSQTHPKGGFIATPAAGDFAIPDMLSTATAIHALALVKAPLADIKENCLDFLDTLWNPKGAFAGSWADATLDCEYTYYALLSLGHLSSGKDATG